MYYNNNNNNNYNNNNNNNKDNIISSSVCTKIKLVKSLAKPIVSVFKTRELSLKSAA